MSRDLESRIRAVVRRRTPKGWTVKEKSGHDPAEGRAFPDARKIICAPIVDRHTLGVFLHEVGHVELGHFDDPTIPEWREEYEADQYAMKAMREEGIAVPQSFVGDARYSLACHIGKEQLRDPDAEFDDEALRFAFPDTWKKAA